MVSASSLSTDERKAYNHLYNLADKEQLGVLTGDIAIVFFEKTQLPGHTLGEIWQLSDTEDTGFLTKEAFYTACRLIGHAQNGQTPAKSLADRSGPLPWFQGVTIPGLAKQPTQPSGTSAASRAPGTPTRQASTPVAPAPTSPSPAVSRPVPKPSGGLSVSPEDKAKYTRLFYNAGPVAGLLDGDKASEILKKSRLPDEKLGQIWNLADTQSRGVLDAGDFVIAMTLIQATMNGTLSSLPDELPDSIYAQAGAYKPGLGSSIPPSVAAIQAPSSPLRAQYTGGNNRSVGPGAAAAIYAQNTGSVQPPSRSSTLGQSQSRNTGAAWAITPLEKSQSDTFFAMLDTSRSGSLSGDVAGPFFMQSGLSGDVLASIWDLSDIKNDGQLDKEEFALARRLVMDTLAGKAVPERLEESFVPPSLRDQWRGSGQQQQVQQSEVQRDLFSLMDDDDASSLPAPVQQVGATAFNAQTAPPAASQFQPASQQGSRIASPAPLQPMLTGASARSATPVRSAPPPVPATTRSALASPPTNATTRDFFDATPVDEEPPQLDERSAELGNLQNQVSQTQRSVSNLRGDRTKLTAEVNKIEEQINELKVSLSQAKAAYDTESTNMTNLEARHSKGSEELKNLKEETIRAESDLSGLKEQKAELEQSILKDKEEIREYTKKLKSTNEEVASLREQLEKLKKEARQQKGMVVVSKKQLSTAEGEEENLQRDIQEEERERAARSAPPPVPALPARPSDSARAVPLPESRASPALSITSARSNNPFDRMGGVAAGAAIGAGLAVPAAAYAARAPSPLHDAFSVSATQQQQTAQTDDFDAFDKEEQDPFGMSTSTASLPPQQAAATSSGFGFDDDFDNAFGAPASQQQAFATTAAPQAPTASRPNVDFDDAFADFDRGTSAPSALEGAVPVTVGQTTEESPAPIAQPAPGKDEPENAPVRAASPTTAERSLQANQPEPELPVEQERAASPTATAPFISAAPAGEAFGNSDEVRSSEGPIDSELQNSSMHGLAPAPYESRSVPDNDNYSDGGEDLAPIRDVEQHDSDSDSDDEEERHKAADVTTQDDEPQSDLLSSSRATYLGDNAGDDIYQKPLDKGKGRAEEPLPGAYPSDDEDTFEDAVPFSQENSMSSPRAAPAQFSTFENTQLSPGAEARHLEEAAAPTAAEQSAPASSGFDDAFDSPAQPSAPTSHIPASEAAPSSDHGAIPDTAVVTQQEAPSAGFAETGMTIAKEAEHTKRPDDFDDFEDISSASRGPSSSEPASSAAAPISARSGGSFEDNFDDDFGFDKQTFSHTITSDGVGKATDPGTEATQRASTTSTGPVSSGFDDAFDDAFSIPQQAGQPQMRVVGSPVAVPSSAPTGFDDDFFTSSSAASAAQPSSNAFVSQATAPAVNTSSPAAPARDDSYIYAPPPGSPPLPQQSQVPEQRQEAPVSQPQSGLQAPALPQRRESDGDIPQVKELRAMGFERSQSIAALEDNQYDVGRAANALLAVNQ